MNFIEAYIAGFSKHYPEKEIKIRGKRQADGSRKYMVVINGDTGGLLMSENDIREATRMFNR